MEREDHLYKAFEYFDKDKSGWEAIYLLVYVEFKHFTAF